MNTVDPNYPLSVWLLLSLYSITLKSNKENDHQVMKLLIVKQILLVSTTWNVRRTVLRMWKPYLGAKGWSTQSSDYDYIHNHFCDSGVVCRNQALPIVAVCCKQSTTYPLKLTSLNKEPTYSAVKGVCSAGLTTTTLPQARAAESFKHAILRGKFHGTIAPTTPTGSCLVYTK